MYCPTCQAEYVAGVKMCPECGVPLVDELPEDAPDIETDIDRSEETMVPVFTTNDYNAIVLIKSALDAEAIDYFFQGENVVGVQPLIEPARLHVRKDQADRVREILAELDLNHEHLK